MMREVLKEMEKSPFMTTRAEGKKMRQTLEWWRDELYDAGASEHCGILRIVKEIEEVLR